VIIRQVADMAGTDRDIRTPNWDSQRLLLARDGVGFSMHETTIYAGTETFMWYRNHIEAVYCVGGEGELEVVETGERIPVRDGTLYTLDGHEKHILRARADMRMICVFNPPIVGSETHDEDGVYPLLTEDASTAPGSQQSAALS
jgi:L-ectoine synthase